MLYSVVLVSAVQRRSAVSIYICPLPLEPASIKFISEMPIMSNT